MLDLLLGDLGVRGGVARNLQDVRWLRLVLVRLVLGAMQALAMLVHVGAAEEGHRAVGTGVEYFASVGGRVFLQEIRGVIILAQKVSFCNHLQFLRPLKGLLAHGALELALALVVVIDMTPQSPGIRRHLGADVAAMLAHTLHMDALHVLLQSCHALQPGTADLTLLQLRLRARLVRVHKLLMLL